jgi:hypothetical protein
MTKMNRRNVLRGMMGGAAVTIGVPFLDCFLNTSGTALADGAPLPVALGTWFWGLGFNPGFWEPKEVGPKYEFGEQIKMLTPFRDKISIFSGFKAYLDGKPVEPHISGPKVLLHGGAPRGTDLPATIDQTIADAIGSRTRFRSIETSANGNAGISLSRRAGSAPNPAETQPVALYMRVFGPEFKDPNAADFTPDPAVVLRKSALSMVTDERQAFLKQIGSADRARMDEYFTSLRELEKKLEIELQKPEPLKACTTPEKPQELTADDMIDNTIVINKLHSQILAHAVACGQTRVVNMYLCNGVAGTRRPGSSMTFHIYTHEEAIDQKLGYQPNVAWFQDQVMHQWLDTLTAFDSIKEGDKTLLDRMAFLAFTDHGYAKIHGLENIPMMVAGSAAGRLKPGIHVQAKSDPVSRVGLTLQQIMGVPVSQFGLESNQTSKTITEIVA